MPLTATAVKQAKPREKPYKLADERGMYLLVNPNGSKYWRLKYRYGGREKTLALGVYPDVSLEKARKKRSHARDQLDDGIDPGVTKKLKKLSQYQEVANSFEAIAREWFETRISMKSESYKDRTWRLLKNDLLPSLARRPINQITAPELLMVLRKVEGRGAVDMAHRAKQTAGQVFRYAVATGRAERDPSGDLKGALKPRTKKHYAALTNPEEAGRLMVAIGAYTGTPVVKTALYLSAYTFQRPGEIRHMEWSEINWGLERWEIPGDKMKMGAEHIVPLSNQALAQLRDLELLTGRGSFVFPSARGRSRPLSENGVRIALRTMGYDNDTMTAHGFRAMARTILDEVLHFRIDYIEHQLAHAVRDPNGRAYNRTKYLAERAQMMQAWANYLDALQLEAAGGNIVTAKFDSA
jgi:integrase